MPELNPTDENEQPPVLDPQPAAVTDPADAQPESDGEPAVTAAPAVPDPAPAPPVRRTRKLSDLFTWQNAGIALLLVVILATGAYFRFLGQNWDDFTHLHPDERFLTGVVTSLTPVSGIGEYFNTAESGLNPNNRGAGFYVYGTLPLFIVKAASGLVADYTLDPSWAGYNGAHLVGRTVSALADILSILFIFLIGRRLYGRWVGVLGAALYAWAVLPIQLSHFWTMDASSNLPLVIAFWFAVRVLDDGGWGNYIGFGVAFGAAVASRINVVPLALVLILATIVRLLPIFEIGFPIQRRQKMLIREGGGLVVGGLVSILIFRLAQPYAFAGPSIFGILPNMEWWRQMQDVSRQVSGQVDFPPNHQWASRIPYLFAWQNMVLWGMGLPLGLTAWLGWVWAGIQVIRARPNWTRHLLPVVWILVYFAWQGGGWVMSMRYYIPLYPFLILLAAWLMVTLVKRAWIAYRDNPGLLRQVGRAASVALLLGVTVLTLVWAFGFSRIYTRQLTRVNASHWILENVPADYSFTITADDGTARMINIGLPNDTVTHDSDLVAHATRYFSDGDLKSRRFTAYMDETVSTLSLSALVDGGSDVEQESLWISVWDVTTSTMLAERTITVDFSRLDWQGDVTLPAMAADGSTNFVEPLAVAFDTPFTLQRNREYEVQVHARAGWPFTVGQVTVGSLQFVGGYFGDGNPPPVAFTTDITGTVDSIHAAYLGDPLQDSDPESLWVGLWDVGADQLLGEGVLNAEFSVGDSPLGQSHDILLDAPVTLEAGREYELRTRAEAGAPFISAGTVIATEGPWDDPIPWKVCDLPAGTAWSPDLPPGLVSLSACQGIDGFGQGYYQGLELYLSYEDSPEKRDIMVEVLNSTDYLTISSNRFYDSLSRLPMRFPMSMAYYDALFAGELGFELVQTFESTFTFGDFTISDQTLPTYDVPGWVNEFEAEEAFHVYDHPVVFVFRKTDAYDPAAVARFFDQISVISTNDSTIWADGTRTVGVIPWNALQASDAPTALMLTDEMQAIQYTGGTWSDLYDTDALINTSDVAAAVAWWGLLIVLGWIIWPTLFVLFPALTDRAYPAAKIAGLLVVSWLAWFGASLRLTTWSQGGLLIIMGLVLLLSVALVWRRRADLIAYVRQYWRRMLAAEGLALLLFVAFIGVRLGNPDLWHPNFGGERPMDFAYLNAVLRSTIFPPINPWYSGGYINYYYYGFVLMGTPIKILGLVPSIGFNLILASLFSLTGMGAFTAAFNLVGGWRKRRKDGAAGARWGSPWVAGIVAMLLAVVLGNLDDIRLIIIALARTGGWRPVTGAEFLPPLDAIFSGLGNLFSGQMLNFSTHWWYWNPTRVMVHTGNAINEIPFFTFLYGDPHAHAFALPLTLLVVTWAINEVLVVGRRFSRTVIEGSLALALGALTVGILAPTNFADWVTYMVLALFALTLANYRWQRVQRDLIAPDGEPPIAAPGPAWRWVGFFGGVAVYYAWETAKRLHINRALIIRWVGQVLAFVVLAALVIAPFNYWYATADAVPELWQGDRTPLWAYFDLNGLFLFLVLSLLVWDTARYLRSVEVRSLVGRGRLVAMTLAGLVWLALIAFVVTLAGYTIALVALPIAFWAALLFFRPGQSGVMRFVWAVVVLATALTFVVDVVVWAGDIGRQNTVFKFYMQVWLLFSVVGGAAFAWLLRSSERWRVWVRGLWLTAATILFTIAAMYPLLATQAKFIDRMAPDAPHTLDGAAFMPYATQGENGEWFSLEEDYEMIRWLQENIVGTPIILEGQSAREYLWGARVSVYTGLPSVVGYNWHQRQQRTLDPLSRLVQQRINNVNTMYNTTDSDIAWDLMQAYDVQFVIVGQLERVYYPAEGLAKFQRMVDDGQLELVFEYGDTRVYQVRAQDVLASALESGEES
jgi:YYY domain-containing protein